MTADEPLLQRLRSGDAAAFERFLREKFDLVYAFVAGRIQDSGEAEEIVLDTLRAAVEGIQGYREEGPFLSWLFGIARNKIADSLRKRSRPTDLRQALPLQTNLVSVEGTDPDRFLLGAEARQLVVHVLAELPHDYGKALRLQYWENRPVLEVAAALGITPKAAEMVLRRAREEFRRRYEEVSGGTHR